MCAARMAIMPRLVDIPVAMRRPVVGRAAMTPVFRAVIPALTPAGATVALLAHCLVPWSVA